jgi:hypothetical protein
MKTSVRPPTKSSRRKELRIDMKIPTVIFVDLMKPLDTGDAEGLEWMDETKSELVPTKTTNALQPYKYVIKKPSLVDKLWRLQEKEPARRMRKEGVMVQCRRGLGSARLHLSDAAEERGERTDLLSQVTGSVTVTLKVPAKERTMPSLTMLFSVSTLNKRSRGTSIGRSSSRRGPRRRCGSRCRRISAR